MGDGSNWKFSSLSADGSNWKFSCLPMGLTVTCRRSLSNGSNWKFSCLSENGSNCNSNRLSAMGLTDNSRDGFVDGCLAQAGLPALSYGALSRNA